MKSEEKEEPGGRVMLMTRTGKVGRRTDENEEELGVMMTVAISAQGACS